MAEETRPTSLEGLSLLDLYEQMGNVSIDRDSVQGSMKEMFERPRSDAECRAILEEHSTLKTLLEADRQRMHHGLMRSMENLIRGGEALDENKRALLKAMEQPDFDYDVFMAQRFGPNEETEDEDEEACEEFRSRMKSLALGPEDSGDRSTDSIPDLVPFTRHGQ